MASPGFWEDNRRAQELIRERAELTRVVTRLSELGRQAQDLGVMLELAQEADDGSLDAEISDGVARLRKELDEFELKVMLSGPHDSKAAILSIHPGAGGTESQDWAQMLMRMYLRWCERNGFKAEVVDLLPGEEAGIKSVTIEVTGEYAYGFLRGEAAMRILKARLYELAQKKQREELAELTGEKKGIAFGSQIRSYTFHPEQRVKDHRTGVEIGNVEAVMDGEIDPFIKAFLLGVRGSQA